MEASEYDVPWTVVKMSPHVSFFYVFCCSTAWYVFYLTLGWVQPHRSPEWNCRLVTVTHAVIVTSMAYWCGFIQGPWPFTDAGGPSTPLQHVTCIICLSYFIFDFMWCLYYQSEGAVMLAHHVISIVGNVATVYRGVYGCEMIATIFGTEMTNPLLQMRWFLRQSGQQDTLFAIINDFAFMSLFGFMRIILASYLVYTYLLNPRTDWFGRSGGIGIYIIGWIFWISILRYAYRKYISSASKRKTQQQNVNGYEHISNGRNRNGHTSNGQTNWEKTNDHLQNNKMTSLVETGKRHEAVNGNPSKKTD